MVNEASRVHNRYANTLHGADKVPSVCYNVPPAHQKASIHQADITPTRQAIEQMTGAFTLLTPLAGRQPGPLRTQGRLPGPLERFVLSSLSRVPLDNLPGG